VPKTGVHGEPSGGTVRPLTGAAADNARRAAERRAAAQEHLGQFAALASFVVELHGIDMVRAKLGKDRALQLFRLAGLDAERIAAGWERTDPVRRQVTRERPSQGYERDPRHHPEVTQEILSGALMDEVNRLIAMAQDELLAHPLPSIGPPGSCPAEATDRAVPGAS
jgi:hypothetical protein